MVRIVFIAFVFATFLFSSALEAKKVALIIGNSGYKVTSPLANPAEDAKLIFAAAKQAGFQTTMALDLSIGGFQKVLRDFRSSADGAEVAMVYYAGHGIEGKGKNWLIPVDAELGAARDLPYEAIELDRVMETISGARMRIVILDACRNNPFARTWKSDSRAVTNGLAGMDVDDVLIIYAAAPGQTAADGKGGNSPFATSLAKRLPQPDLPVQLLGGTVRDDVLAATGGDQRPFVSASITGTPIYLVPRTQVAVAVPAPAQQSSNLEAIEDLTWQGAIAAANVSSYSVYLSQFPKGKYAVAASRKISEAIGLSDPAATTGTIPVGAVTVRKFVLSNVTIKAVKLSGISFFPDNIFLSFTGGDRFPERGAKPHSIRKGQSWTIEQDFTFQKPTAFRVMEHDPVGGHDEIGIVDLEADSGTYSKTLDGDKSEYQITYTLAVSN